VTSVQVDDTGVRATGATEVVLDVLFDERRIWSFHLHRDGEHQGGDTYLAEWPQALRRAGAGRRARACGGPAPARRWIA
jgi:hypothetical protein